MSIQDEIAELYRINLGRAPESQDVIDAWAAQFGSSVDASERQQFAMAALPEYRMQQGLFSPIEPPPYVVQPTVTSQAATAVEQVEQQGASTPATITALNNAAIAYHAAANLQIGDSNAKAQAVLQAGNALTAAIEANGGFAGADPGANPQLASQHWTSIGGPTGTFEAEMNQAWDIHTTHGNDVFDTVMSVLAFVPGPHQPFIAAYNAMSALEKGNIISAIASAAGVGGINAASTIGTALGATGNVAQAVGNAIISGANAAATGQNIGQAALTGAAISGLSSAAKSLIPTAMGGTNSATTITDAQLESLVNDYGLTNEQVQGALDAWQQGGTLTAAQSSWADRIINTVSQGNPTDPALEGQRTTVQVTGGDQAGTSTTQTGNQVTVTSPDGTTTTLTATTGADGSPVYTNSQGQVTNTYGDPINTDGSTVIGGGGNDIFTGGGSTITGGGGNDGILTDYEYQTGEDYGIDFDTEPFDWSNPSTYPWQNIFSAAGDLFGGYLSGEAATQAAQTQAAAQVEAARIAAEAARFRPVGVTTRFGQSQFGYDPQGNLTSAGYQLSPELRAQQDALMINSGQNLAQWQQATQLAAPLQTGAQRAMELGQGYLARTPQEQAAQYMSEQQGLLAPGRERELAALQNRLQAQGRGGLAIGGTSTGMMAANPEMEAYYNSIRQQDLGLAAQATQGGQQYATFGAGLMGTGGDLLKQMYGTQTAAFQPYQTALGGAQQLEQLGQEPMNLGASLGSTASAAAAAAGNAQAQGMWGAAQTMQPANAYSPWGALLSGAGQAIGQYGQQQQQYRFDPFTGRAL